MILAGLTQELGAFPWAGQKAFPEPLAKEDLFSLVESLGRHLYIRQSLYS
jgi:hypothetical protein